MRNIIVSIVLVPFILLVMGCFLLYFLVYIRIKRNRSYAVPETKGGSGSARLSIALVAKECPPLMTDISAFTQEIARAMVALGHQVHIVTIGAEENDQKSAGYWIHRVSSKTPLIFDCIKRAGFPEAGEHLANSYLINRQLLALQKKFKFDVIEFPEKSAQGLFYYLRRSNPPFVVRFHTSEGFNYQLNARQFNLDCLWVRTMERYWITRARAAIGVSIDIVRKYEHFYHLDFSGVPVMPYPVGHEWFDSTTISPGEISGQVLFVGRFDLKNGPHVLLQAIPKILETNPGANFIFAGVDCGLREHCEEIIAGSGISPRVTFIEPISQNQIVEHFRRATVCVFPALWENYPYRCLEAMATGCAVVACNVGGFSDIIEDRVSGLLVDAGDSDSLADAVTEVIVNDELRNSLRQNAPDRIRELCDCQQIAERTLDVYRGVLRH